MYTWITEDSHLKEGVTMPDTVHHTPADINQGSPSGADMNVDAGLTARQQEIEHQAARRQ